MSGCCCGGNKGTTVVIDVEGMSCGHCKAAVEKALTGLAGVNKAEVDLAAKNVSVSYDPAKVQEVTLRKAISDAGYEVK